MKYLIFLSLLLAAPLHSNPVPKEVLWSGVVNVGGENIELDALVEFTSEGPYTLVFTGRGDLRRESRQLEKGLEVKLWVGQGPRRRTILSVKLQEGAAASGLPSAQYLELVAEQNALELTPGDTLDFEAARVWRLPALEKQSFRQNYLIQDRGTGRLELIRF